MNTFKLFIQKYTPLQQILFLAFVVRLISVVFSKGFGFHDDHFLIIEASQSWVDGYDYNNWLPSETDPNRQPSGHPLFYVGFQFLFFKLLKFLSITDPQTKMFYVRLLHALWSLLIIKYAYKITQKLSNTKIANYVGILLALFWFMPFISVRNLAELVCLPPLMLGLLLIIEKQNFKNYLFAGLLFGIAFSIRFQIVFMLIGLGIAILILKTPFKYIVSIILGFIITVLFTCGLVDYLIWKIPFAEFMGYVQYNLDNATSYGTNNWHMYFDLLLGLLIPPLSFVLFAGYFYSYKKTIVLFWPVLIYFAFHTYFPNKQERFILTIIPIYLIGGTIGAFMLYEKYKSKFSKKIVKGCVWFIVILNTILLLFLSPSYGKRHRVESVYYLSKLPDCNAFYIEDSNKEDDFLMPPLFYFGKWFSVYGINKVNNPAKTLDYYNGQKGKDKPNYIIFMQAEHINERVAEMKKYFPKLTYVTTIEPSNLDQLLYWLNPLNDNHTAYIYKL